MSYVYHWLGCGVFWYFIFTVFFFAIRKIIKSKYWARTFKVITISQAIDFDLSFKENIFGDLINKLNCRSVWVDDKGREYRVREVVKIKNPGSEPGVIV